MSSATMHTNHGPVEIEFFDEDAPKTVENFRTRLRPQGSTLTTRPDGRVTIAGGWEAGAPAAGGGLQLRFTPVACGVRMRVGAPPPGAGIEYSAFFAHRPRRHGAVISDGSQRIRARSGPSVSLLDGYASADNAHLVRAVLGFPPGSPHDDLTICAG
jgi:hypothetical protein